MEHSLALLSNGTAMAWGDNENGQLGIGYKEVKKGQEIELVEIEKSAVPVAVKELTGATAVSAGGRRSLALLSDGTVMAWGSNLFGQLGDGAYGGPAETPQTVDDSAKSRRFRPAPITAWRCCAMARSWPGATI